MMKRLICRLIGHDIDPCDVYATECFRCGLVFDYDARPQDDLWFMLRYYAWTAWFRHSHLRQWFKCPDCDRRFGRHKKDCMPF